MIMKSALREYLLCHQGYMAKCKSLLPLEDDSPAEDCRVGLIFEYSLPHRGNDSLDSQVAHALLRIQFAVHTLSEHLNARRCRRQATDDSGFSQGAR